MRRKIKKLWKADLAEKNKVRSLCVMISIVALMMTGCGEGLPEVPESGEIVVESEVYPSGEDNFDDAESIAAVYRDIYDEAVETNTLGSLETMRRIVARLGENGYVAVDSENQVDMAGAEQAIAFCKTVDEKKSAKLTIIAIHDSGFRKFDIETEDGNVNVVRGYYQYDQNGCLQNRNTVCYPADMWQYTEEGYLIFEGSYFSEENLVLTLSEGSEHTALRVLPLDESCRELNRKYILPVSYGRNNIFLTDWNEEDFGELNFYDVFDIFYPVLYKQPVPYVADKNLEVGAVYQIPEEIFENVIMTYFHIDKGTLRRETTYSTENAAYEYRPRGFYEAEYPDIPYPEVVDYIVSDADEENPDGTITLIVNAVYPNSNTSMAYSHRTVIRPLNEDGFQFVSNQMISLEDEGDIWWHSDRLSGEEWLEMESTEEIPVWESTAPVSVLTTEEEQRLRDEALSAAKQCMEFYKDISVSNPQTSYSRIENFSDEQRKRVVKCLGEQGLVCVSDDINMENYQKVEEFYSVYLSGGDAMVTVFDVYSDGNICALTFVHRSGKIQSYYVLIGWQESGIPEIKSFGNNDLEEMKLTEKGYFIYTNTVTIMHGNLREYYRVKPLSDECRELTKKYIYGLSFVNYNMLVTNWDAGNVEDILMPCMFEDIYRVYTGEPLEPEKGMIPVEVYERVMTTCFPVSVEQLREYCGYHADTDGYEYEMIFPRQYPPFGEVVDYTRNDDGTLTLYVDGVWPDYDSDYAFTNRIVVQPFADGTFRYLSNSIEQKELEIPRVEK